VASDVASSRGRPLDAVRRRCMAKRNEYSYSKWLREQKKRKKIEEKRAKKAARKGEVPAVDPKADPNAPPLTSSVEDETSVIPTADGEEKPAEEEEETEKE